MRPLPLEAGLQALKAHNRCGSNWDPFAPSPCKLNLASVVGGQRGRRVLDGFKFIDTGDDVDTNDDSEDLAAIRRLLNRHVQLTGSAWAMRLLEGFEHFMFYFRVVRPKVDKEAMKQAGTLEKVPLKVVG